MARCQIFERTIMIPTDLKEEAKLLAMSVLDNNYYYDFSTAVGAVHDYLVDTHGNYKDIIKSQAYTPEDLDLIKKALHVYLIDCMRTEGYSERDPHPDVSKISSLLQKL